VRIIRKCMLLLSLACFLLWFPEVKSGCDSFHIRESSCQQLTLFIILVCFIKFINSIIFASLISYSSEAFPTVVRALGYGFTLTFGRMTTFMAPFFVR